MSGDSTNNGALSAIGAAKDVAELVKELQANQHETVELVILRSYRTPNGELEFHFSHTRSLSSFRLAGALLWLANYFAGGEANG